jgi:hypothetical protein
MVDLDISAADHLPGTSWQLWTSSDRLPRCRLEEMTRKQVPVHAEVFLPRMT